MGRAKTNASGQIQRSRAPGSDLATFLTRDLAPQIKTALPKHLDSDRMARIALTALRTTPKLGECDKYSFAAAILSSAQLGLEVNTPLGHAYLIPRMNRRAGQMECNLQLGYQGMLELARRSGMVSSIFAHTVHEGDEFEETLGLDPDLRHVPNHDVDRTERNMTHVYAVAVMKDGGRQFVVLSKREVIKRKNVGQSGPAWKDHFLAMARKTAVRALFTWIPKSPEMARAGALDDHSAGAVPREAAIDVQVHDAVTNLGVLPAGDAEPSESVDIDQETGEVIDEEPVFVAALRAVLACSTGAELLAAIKQHAVDLEGCPPDDWKAIEGHATELGLDPRDADAALQESVG